MNSKSHLKDFQIATVDYVFKQFTKNCCNRFLVADEVGLGKTMVARGIIQKFYDYFKETEKEQLNIIYICSNQSIARQNISRLNIEKQKGFSPPQINRINYLAITQVEEANGSFLKIVALSPNTSFNISKGGGTVKERAILFHILCKHQDFSGYKEKLKKIFRLDVNETNWNEWTRKDNWVITSLHEEIVLKFNSALTSKNQLYNDLLFTCEERFNSKEDYSYRKIIGGLRKILASICVEYLKPDLIIMDEFQRFKYLINEDEDNDIKLITESLFTNDDIKILLLSATPYKMYSMQADEDSGENHFEEFEFIVNFLLKDEDKQNEFKKAWDEYSNSLLNLDDEIHWDSIKEKKQRVEELLRTVIARTERITVSEDKNTMLRSSEPKFLCIKPNDIQNFLSTDAVAVKLKDVNSPIEYCKSSPYPFSFMEGYQLQRIIQKEIQKGNIEIKSALRRNKSSFLPIEKMNNYEPIGTPNAKLSYLLEDILYNGGSDLLWIPPSLPYYELDGAYKDKEKFSKTLVFSSWVMVPKMIAALSSYECERLTIGNKKSINNANDKGERKYFHTGSERQPKARLRFRIENNNYSTLSHYALLYPCVTLSDLWKPLGKFESLNELLNETTNKIDKKLKEIPISEFVTEPNKQDDRWALLYMLLLDRKFETNKITHFKNNELKFDWEWFEKEEEISLANDYYEKVFRDILFAETQNKNIPAWQLRFEGAKENPLRKVFQELKLGQPPKDIAKQLAYLTIASPAICSYRLLSGYSKNEKQQDFVSFYSAFRIADSFRKFFNTPENISVIDKYAISDKSYWQNVLIYSASGNFQSMLDEFANAMIDHNGIWDYSVKDKVYKLVELILGNIRLRTVSVTGHTYDSFIKESKSRHFRCHFGVALNQSLDNEKDVMRSDSVRDAFNSPFRPFILSTTSIGQEGLDFHLYCRKILHWNLPANPVDFEQREGRINRFKNLAIRQNLAKKYRDKLQGTDLVNVWNQLYDLAIQVEKDDKSDLVPYWHVEPENIFIERQVPIIPYSKEVHKLNNLLKTISVYRIALGQPRQEELVNHLIDNFGQDEIEKVQLELLINLSPYKRQ